MNSGRQKNHQPSLRDLGGFLLDTRHSAEAMVKGGLKATVEAVYRARMRAFRVVASCEAIC